MHSTRNRHEIKIILERGQDGSALVREDRRRRRRRRKVDAGVLSLREPIYSRGIIFFRFGYFISPEFSQASQVFPPLVGVCCQIRLIRRKYNEFNSPKVFVRTFLI